jgi:arylsulfatase A-like enzyme
MEQRRLDGYETDALTDAFLAHIGEHLGRARPGGGVAEDRDAAEGGGVAEAADPKPAQSAERRPFFAVLSVQPPHSPYVGPGVRTPVLARPGAPEAPDAPEAGPEKAGLRDAGPVWAPKAPAEISLRPNVPHVARIREQARLDIAGYASMVENLDWNLGRLLTGLRRLDADRETWICFFSDHGDMLGSHGQWEKSSPWEESIRIPFIVARVGGHQKMRTGVSSAVLNHVDIGPTSLGLCGIEKPAWAVGFDYSSHCLRGGEARPARGVGAEADGEPSSAYLQQIPRKFHRHSVNRAWRGVVTRDGWKYVCTPRNDWLLFNLNEDPYEQANLCYDTVYQAEKEACHRELAGWLEETGDDFELPDIELE